MLKSLQRKTLGDIRENRNQFIAVWLTVMLGVMFYGSMYPAGLAVIDSFHRTYDEQHYAHFQMDFDAAPASVSTDASHISGVEHVEGRIIYDAGIQLDPGSPFRITMRLISIPDERTSMVNQSDVIEGRLPKRATPSEIALIHTFAKEHDIDVGDQLSVFIADQHYTLDVVGLVFNPEYIVLGRSVSSPFPTPSTFGVGWMRYQALSQMTTLEGQINNLVVHLNGTSATPDNTLTATVAAQLRETYGELPGFRLYTRTESASGGIVQALIDGNMPIMIFFSGIFLAGSTIITSILLGRIVKGEQRRIGTMRALGVTRAELLRHYLSFGLLIGVTAGIVGTVLGYLNSFWVMQMFIDRVAGGVLPAFSNTPRLEIMLLGFVVAVISSVGAGLYPAWVASATEPGVALRPVLPARINALSRLPLSFLPMTIRQSLRNLFRVPGRAISTALGVALGAMMLFSAVAIWDTTDRTFGDYFNSLNFDLRVDVASLQEAEALEQQMLSLEHVGAAQAVLAGPIKVNAYDTIAIALDENEPYLEMTTLAGEPYFSNADSVWIGNNLAHSQNIAVGDTVRIDALGQTHTVTVAGIVSQPLGSPVYVPRSLIERWAPGGVFLANSVYIRADDIEAARDATFSVPGVIAIEETSVFKHDIDIYLAFFYTFTLIFGGFGAVLTLALLYNAVTASLRERQDELAILRALGHNRSEIARMVLLELALMVVCGAMIGVPLGEHFGYRLASSYENDFYGVVHHVETLSRLLIIGLLAMVVFLAAIPGLQGLQRLNLGQISKSQSI